MYSPWGKVDNQRVVAEGVLCVSTPSHGGVKLDRKRNALIPAYMRAKSGWYEEDCQWSIPYVILKLGSQEQQEQALKTFRSWYPTEYEQYTNTVLLPGESYKKDQYLFNEENKNKLVGISAYGPSPLFSKGFVCVTATLGGIRGNAERQFLVPAKEYENRNHFGFVIEDPSKYREVKF
jgi:hypothetical protein